MKQFIRDYLTFNKRERNGLFVLLVIISLLIFYLNISDRFIKNENIDFSKFEQEIAQLNSSIAPKNKTYLSDINPDDKQIKNPDSLASDNPENTKAQYFNFNPNYLPENKWQQLGLSDKQIKAIKNYETKGGKFRTKEDVKKMYCLPAKQYEALEPFISIPEIVSANNNFNKERNFAENKTTKYPDVVVELNSADSTQLTKVKGFGGFYAKTIIKYRNSLGGFVAKEQLMEIWKFDKEKFEAVKNYVVVDDSEIKTININTCTATELKHPYLSWNATNAIVNYRNKHGKFKTLEDIKETDLVDDETYLKIVPYLTL
ncbi:MAG: helix-hairpin-helix domain-containing protein [Bacteroidota bacterium]